MGFRCPAFSMICAQFPAGGPSAPGWVGVSLRPLSTVELHNPKVGMDVQFGGSFSIKTSGTPLFVLYFGVPYEVGAMMFHCLAAITFSYRPVLSVSTSVGAGTACGLCPWRILSFWRTPVEVRMCLLVWAMMGFALAEGGSFPSPAGSRVGRGKVLGPPGHTF